MRAVADTVPYETAHPAERVPAMKKAPRLVVRGAFFQMVGGIGIEPMTPSVSGKCSPTELTAHGRAWRTQGVYQLAPGASNGFARMAMAPAEEGLLPGPALEAVVRLRRCAPRS